VVPSFLSLVFFQLSVSNRRVVVWWFRVFPLPPMVPLFFFFFSLQKTFFPLPLPSFRSVSRSSSDSPPQDIRGSPGHSPGSVSAILRTRSTRHGFSPKQVRLFLGHHEKLADPSFADFAAKHSFVSTPSVPNSVMTPVWLGASPFSFTGPA